MTSVRVAFVLIFVMVQLCTAEYVVYGRKMTLDANLPLNPNRWHHPLITQLSRFRVHLDCLKIRKASAPEKTYCLFFRMHNVNGLGFIPGVFFLAIKYVHNVVRSNLIIHNNLTKEVQIISI